MSASKHANAPKTPEQIAREVFPDGVPTDDETIEFSMPDFPEEPAVFSLYCPPPPPAGTRPSKSNPQFWKKSFLANQQPVASKCR